MDLEKFSEAKKNGTLEQEFLSHNPELDRFIIEGMLEQPDVLLEEFGKAGVDKALCQDARRIVASATRSSVR